MVLKFIWLKHVTYDHIILFLTNIGSANSSSSVAIFQIQSLVDLFTNLLGRSSEAPLLSFINMWCCIGKALNRESTKWRHVLRVASHQEQLLGALGPGVQARVQAQLGTLVITRRPVTTSTWSRKIIIIASRGCPLTHCELDQDNKQDQGDTGEHGHDCANLRTKK